jgi:superfamily I DNA and RNA helicase
VATEISMSIDIIQGTSQKPASSGELVKLLEGRPDLSGRLYVGYPIIGTSAGPHLIDALLISMHMGIVVFDLIEGGELGDFELRQDDSANKLEARLKTYPELTERRNLRIPIYTISFGTAVRHPGQNGVHYPVVNLSTTVAQLKELTWPEADQSVFEAALSAIQSVSTIRKTRIRRTVHKADSRGAKLKQLEDSIATLDNSQSEAVIQTVDGVQRIRGLAGSGKTIVLALKAAYLHAQHPDWRIGVTFLTRSLKGHFQRLINNFAVEQTSEEPDWEKVRILHAWGAPGPTERSGIYYEFCRENTVEYFDFRSARGRFGLGREFSGACQYALSQTRENRELYDVILIDEAQDFSPAFLRLCHRLLKEPKRLVYAYDELQNLSGTSLPSMEELFRGSPADASSDTLTDGDLSGPGQDIILDRCYRNSRPVLVTAHALGFGVYRESPDESRTGLIQMFDNPHLWTEVGYRLRSGALADGSPVSLERTSETSPSFLESHSPIEDLIQFVTFRNQTDQAEWLAQAIQRNLNDDEMRHSDIIVINPDPPSTRAEVGPVRSRLLDMGIQSHLAGVDTSPDTFFRPDEESVTFTGIYRAKGNEAGMVYMMNAQDCHSSARNLATIRNRLFTAITRSKSWIRVLGFGDGMEALQREYDSLRNRDFRLEFTYPDAELRQQLRIVHRDLSAQERRRLESGQRSFHQLVTEFESGDLRPEDLDPLDLAKLKDLLR